MRLGVHARELEPGIEVRVQRCRVVMRGDPEKMTLFLRHEGAEMGKQRRLHVVGDGQDLALIEKTHDAIDGFQRLLLVLFLAGGRDQRRQIAVALLLEFERSPGPIELALEQPHLILPGQRHEVHVALIPGVIFPADAGRPRLVRRLCLEPCDKFFRCGHCPRQRGVEFSARIGAGQLFEGRKIYQVLADVADPGDPKIARIAGKVFSRLRKQRGYDVELPDQALFLIPRQRKIVDPNLDDGVMRGTFVGRHVAARHPDGVIKGRITRPRL